jgi:two-component system response regulator GlrR
MSGKAAEKPLRSPRMLIVDDEESITRTMQMMFEERGFRVQTAFSCSQALKTLRNGHNYDAVITDLNMEAPDIGLEVARAAKRATPAPVVVVCTGYANLENARVALDMHVDYLATKPVDLDQLFAAVDRLLERRQDLPSAPAQQKARTRESGESARHGAGSKRHNGR